MHWAAFVVRDGFFRRAWMSHSRVWRVLLSFPAGVVDGGGGVFFSKAAETHDGAQGGVARLWMRFSECSDDRVLKLSCVAD